MKRTLLFILFCLFAVAAAQAQKIVVSASVSQPQILIGEPLQLTLRVQMPETANVDWFVTDTFPHFEIQYRSAIDTVRSGAGQQILVQNIRVTSWDSGRWNLPSFSVKGSNRTTPIAVRVGYSPMDPAQPYHDVKDVLAVQRPGAQSWIWYLVGAALLLLFILLLFPGRKKKEVVQKESPETAYREAIKGLDMLQKRTGELPAKEFYTELVGLFRNYLVKRKDYQSSSKTTSDLQQQLPAWGLQKEVAGRLLETLQLSDAVKFARYEAGAAEQKASVAHVRETIVELERKKPV